MCILKKTKPNFFEGCNLHVFEFYTNENWPHIWNLRFPFHRIMNITQYTSILIIRAKPRWLIPCLFMCCRFELVVQHRGWGGVWMNILLFWLHTCIVLTKWLNNACVNFHFSLHCGRPFGCMWFQEYPRPPNHGHLTSIEIIHVGNGILKI
jgi:hypothetical protein